MGIQLMRPILIILKCLTADILLVKLTMIKRKAACFDDQDDKNTESNRNSAIPNFIPRIMADDEILERINFLNFEQHDVFNIVHNWAKEYAKHMGANVKPVHVFFSGSRGTDIYHLVKTIYNAVSKTLLLNLAVNFGRTIHFTLGITPGAKLSGKVKASLKSDSHVPENFCQIKIFPSHVRKNTIICLFGV